jgi:cellulose synthase/poly-beta-1,6-N-acetylglucosamine synthase-like glycosyltransferase/exo-beta-1,3-glucanase (GH17 family)
MRRVVFALALVSLATVAIWFSLDWRIEAPDWTGTARGLSYNPSGLYEWSSYDTVSAEHIRDDLDELAHITTRVRTYSVSQGLDQVPAVAAKMAREGFKVSVGLWLSGDFEANEAEIEKGLRVINAYPAVIDRVFVGNEVVLRGEMTPAQLAHYMKRVKRAAPKRIQVSTAESWDGWLLHPELGTAADFIGAHFLPFWQGVPVEEALAEIKLHMDELKTRFPDKQVVIAEVGWPSEGRRFKEAEADGPGQAAFLRRFFAMAKENTWDYYIIEAYDQPWKVRLEGAVGAFWGVYDAEGKPKFDFKGTLSSLPEWPYIALAAILLSVLLGGALLRQTPHLHFAGILFLASSIAIIVSGVIAIFWGAALQYATAAQLVAFGGIVLVGSLAGAVIVTEGIEMAHALWRTTRRPMVVANNMARPFVSIHVPCYNEPAAMMRETLDALARLDYPNFEVVVLDNNTRDEAVWRPVEAHCAKLGPRFRFFHFDNVKGFKAGALNIAFGLTDPKAEIVAVIDSDYQVEPNWLTDAACYFEDRKIGLVQAPQDYRDSGESLFKRMTYEEYSGFFRIGMVERHEDNAIIQHGTMTMMRRKALAEVGGWAEWCITEDTELGLRLFEAGWHSVYIDRSLGRGVMPDTLGAYKVQRHRWVYGAMQILKRHLGALAGRRTQLSRAQKYHFVSGWLPWIADALAFFFTVGGVVWSALMIWDPFRFEVPLPALTAVAIALFAVKVTKTLSLYPHRVKTGFRGALAASIAGLALSHTVARAVISGLLTSAKPFLRTPKLEATAPVRAVIAVAWEEIVLLFALVAAIGGTWQVRGGWDDEAGLVWIAMLAIQALPYAATLAMAIISVLPHAMPRPATTDTHDEDEPAPDIRRAA